MAFEVVYGKEGGSDYKVLAAPSNYKKVDIYFPNIPRLRYPDIPSADVVVFCCTQGQRSSVPHSTVLSCIKFFSGRAGNYFAQHLILTKEEEEKFDAGPVWLIKRRRFYIQNLSDWSQRDPRVTEEYSWRPGELPPSNYRIGAEDNPETHETIIKIISDAWNGANEQAKYVLLFDPEEQGASVRLDLLYNLYAKIKESKKRWQYRFCTFAGPGLLQPPAWNIVFIAESDRETQRLYRNGYDFYDMKTGQCLSSVKR